jgi:phage shock protein PspC (stress-responsive transcriptional regulator)
MRLTSSDLDKMKADPDKALEGLSTGLAAYFGIPQESVTITATDPSLTGRRMDAARFLSDSVDFIVSYTVTGPYGTIGDKAKSLDEGDPTQHGALADLLSSSLQARGIEVTVQSSFPTPNPTPAPSPMPEVTAVAALGTSPFLLAALFVLFVVVAVIVGFIAHTASAQAKEKAHKDTKSLAYHQEIERRVQEELNRTEPREHRHQRQSNFAEEAGGLEQSQAQEDVTHNLFNPVVDAVEFNPDAALSLQRESYMTDPTGGAVQPASGGIAGLFNGFFCNACQTTEQGQNEMEVAGVTTGDVTVQVQ